MDDAGFWYLAGRADDTLTIAGRRIGPGEVEAAAVSHPAVRQAAAVGIGDPLQGTRLVLVLVPKPGIRPSGALGDDVARHVAERLGDATRAAAVCWVEAIPATRAGRVPRDLIRRLLAGEDPANRGQLP
ncbi:MAG: hypothetical protein MUF27_12865 [Acidobacteria bacterium]|nr:hypothetical protein [Acidobacteriota bacterium]